MGVATVATFSVLLAAIPLAAFYAAAHGALDPAFRALLGSAASVDANRPVLSGVAAVVCVNLVVAAFLVAAWMEPAHPAAADDRSKRE